MYQENNYDSNILIENYISFSGLAGVNSYVGWILPSILFTQMLTSRLQFCKVFSLFVSRTFSVINELISRPNTDLN